jgi:ubiquinone/menaquinone biosynthesis C-methylase UbiE
MNSKIILDACCGSRMFWFDKENPHTIFADIRNEKHILCDGRTLEVHPDIQMDFTCMSFEDNAFKLIVFDPPHLNRVGANSWTAKKYGKLGKDWKTDIAKGFNECMRVLDNYGVLIFKWNETQIPVSKILEVIQCQPLFGHKSGRHSKTIWLCFMKIP